MSDTISPDAIRAARKAAGLTQAEAAHKAGVTRATIQNVEKARRSPSGNVLVALSRAYGVPMESFVAHDPNATAALVGRKQPETTPAPLASTASESASGAR